MIYVHFKSVSGEGREIVIPMPHVPLVGEIVEVWDRRHMITVRAWFIDTSDEDTVHCEVQMGEIA